MPGTGLWCGHAVCLQPLTRLGSKKTTARAPNGAVIDGAFSRFPRQVSSRFTLELMNYKPDWKPL